MNTSFDTNYMYSRLPTEQNEAVVSFSNADSAWQTQVMSSRDPTYDVGYREDGDLGAFLARPVKIYETDWTTAVPLTAEIDPWSLFLNNVNVKRRIENYYLLRGDLDIKIMINGNGFYYGRVIASYQPLKDFRQFDAPVGTPLYKFQASQRPHVYLDPTTSTGGDLCVPYFYPKNWINLTEGEYNKLGTLALTEVNPLRQANSGTGSVSIVIFASMKNLDLTIPTANPVGSISPESGCEPLSVSEISTIQAREQKRNLKILRKRYNHAVAKYINARIEFKKALIAMEDDDLANIYEDQILFGELIKTPLQDICPESGEEKPVDTKELKKSLFRSQEERDRELIEQAKRELAEEEPRSRICGDPIAILAAALAGLSAAGFAREINVLRGRAKQLEKAISDADALTEDINDNLTERTKEGMFVDIEPESGKAPAKKKGGGKNSNSSKPTNGGGDEYGTGIISKPASVLAKAAGALTNVPGIGQYAMASKIALSGVANIARIFGYSRPPIVDSIKPMKVINAGQMAPTDADELVHKLALDSKQELTIDPSTVGIEGTDQMSFAHVLQKESLVTTFVWDETNVGEDVLFQTNVCPGYFRTTGVFPGTAGSGVCMPLTMVSQMFKYWRGSIVFRFQIVASNFHKGRLRVTYDPYATGVFDASEYNVTYNRIIDLAENRDFELTVNWSQPEAWKEVPQVAGLQVTDIFNAGALNPLAGRTNGMLQVSVVNDLTKPNSTVSAPVEINVFVRGGPDLEYAGPTDAGISTFTYNDPAAANARRLRAIKPESGEENVDNEATDTGMSDDHDNAPVGVTPINDVGGTEIMPQDNSLMVYMGEKVCSLRSLMKRYCWHEVYDVPGLTASLTYFRQFIRDFPDMRGYVPQGRHASLGGDFNFTHMTFMNWIVPCYAGRRGGIRRKIHHIGLENRTMMTACRDANSIRSDQQTQTANSLSGLIASELSDYMSKNSENGRGGCIAIQCATGGCLEYELPFYSEFRFAHTHDYGDKTTLTWKPSGYHHAIESMTQFNSSVDTQQVLRSSVAIGEDFSTFWFLNCPTFFSYDNDVPQ